LVKLLHNPIMYKMLVAVFATVAGLLAAILAVMLLRAARKNFGKVEKERVAVENNPLFSLAAYNGVIQQLREQEKELKKLREHERDRAAATENISEAVLSNLTSGVVFFDRVGIVRQVNGAAKSLLGYASPFGFHIRDLFCGIREVRWISGDTSDSPAPFVAEMERTIRDATPFQRVEADYVTPTGEKRVLGIGASAVRGKKGEILGVSCLIADLTHISELSRQVQFKENLASLGEMSAGIAHEFKNSLATISGYAQMLVQEAASDTGREFAGKIALETESLSRIVTEFLEFARPHGMARQTVNLNAILEDCAQETGVDLQLPPAPVMDVTGDAVLLRQAISNLLRNSAEASRNGSPVKVSVRGSVEADKLQVSLTDNGRGIAAEDLSRIFIPFFTTKATGTGLGLALVHRIISEHGGAIAVTSDSQGTTFTLTLPANQAAAVAHTNASRGISPVVPVAES
jgi:nitrogen fixation/metabolism regulation signal transduction histidine kinase